MDTFANYVNAKMGRNYNAAAVELFVDSTNPKNRETVRIQELYSAWERLPLRGRVYYGERAPNELNYRASAYTLFCVENRDRVQREHNGSLGRLELQAALGAAWAMLPEYGQLDY
jgi:hypothetical protein